MLNYFTSKSFGKSCDKRQKTKFNLYIDTIIGFLLLKSHSLWLALSLRPCITYLEWRLMEGGALNRRYLAQESQDNK